MGTEQRADLLVLEHRPHAVGADDAVAHLDDDDVQFLLRLRRDRLQEALRDRRDVGDAGGRGEAAVEERQGRQRAVVLHVQEVLLAGDAGHLEPGARVASGRQLRDDLAAGDGLARVHARAGDDDDRRAVGEPDVVGRRQRGVGDVQSLPAADRHPEHLAAEGVAEVSVLADRLADDPAEV